MHVTLEYMGQYDRWDRVYLPGCIYYQKFQLKIFKKPPEVLPEWERFVNFEK